MKKILVGSVTLAALLGGSAPKGAAQDLNESGDLEKRDAYTVNLAFSKDGSTLREIRMVTPTSPGRFRNVRVIIRDGSSGKIRRRFDLQPDTELFSLTTDVRIAVIFQNRNRSEEHVRLFLVDTETGQTQDFPSNWFDLEDHLTDASISGDGRLVSIYTNSGPADAPRVVSVYDWQTKKLVAQQATGFSAGGFDGGGVSVDGKIEFSNNRSGSQIVDPKTGQLLLTYGPNSVRSPDGAWVVELAGNLHGRDRLDTTVMNGLNGKILGRLDLKITDQLAISWSGVFCGTSGRFIAWNPDSVLVFDIPSRKQIASVPVEAWRDKNPGTIPDPPSVGCNWTGKRLAIRSGARFTVHDLE